MLVCKGIGGGGALPFETLIIPLEIIKDAVSPLSFDDNNNDDDVDVDCVGIIERTGSAEEKGA